MILASGVPTDRLRLRFKGAGSDPHPLGHHENRIKTDAKLTDDLGKIHLLIFGGFEELPRPRLGNRPEILDNFLAGHPNPGVANRQQPVFLVHRDSHRQIGFRVQDFLVGHLLKTHPVQRI